MTIGDGLSVLVVEDSEDSAGMLAALLEDEGHRVRVAHDGPRSLELFEEEASRGEAPHLIVLDLGLPRMSGFEVATEMRRRYGAGFRIVALTGYSDASDRARAVRSGIDDFVIKPFRANQLMAILDEERRGRGVAHG